MFKTAVLGSGSKGNCCYVGTSQAAIILDAGLSVKRTMQALDDLSVDPSFVVAIIISHDHSDHVNSAGALARKLKVPIYLTLPTQARIDAKLGRLPAGVINFTTGDHFAIGDIAIESFSAPHDGVDGNNFVFYPKNDLLRRLVVATDLGYGSRLLQQKLAGACTVILESNHDEKMLRNGPYPWPLKQRISSRHGHLSNNQATELLAQMLHAGLNNIVLAHLSEENNEPDLAFINTKKLLEQAGHTANLLVALQHQPTPLLDV